VSGGLPGCREREIEVGGGGRESSSPDLGHRHLLEVNRARLVTAAIEALADGGLERLTVASVIGRAHISRKTFYEVFADRHDCFGAVFAHISARGLAAVSHASAPEAEWLGATRSGLSALLALIDDEPLLSKVWFVESLAGHSDVLRQRARVLARAADAIHFGSSTERESSSSSRLIAESTVGGIAHIIHTRLVEANQEPFATLSRPFMYLITLPYLGPAHASSELRRAPLHVPRQKSSAQPKGPGRSLRDSKVRLTYRTIRTLGAISDRPGASNLEVSTRCGITDQGQISKLLSRLGSHELIENRGLGRAVGASNAWYITLRGSELLDAVIATEALAGTPRRGAPGAEPSRIGANGEARWAGLYLGSSALAATPSSGSAPSE
jgi:AcrR family transcriptional regulator